MPKFEIGEIAIVIKATGEPHLLGEEVEIIGLPGISRTYPDDYQIDHPSIDHTKPGKWIISPSSLKKRPPKNNAREWFDENIKLNPKVLVEA